MESSRVGPYQVEIQGNRLSVSRPTLGWLRLCRRTRPLLNILGPSEVTRVQVSRRQLRGPEIKGPWRPRPWQVEVVGREQRRIGRGLRFSCAEEAERCAEVLRRYASQGLAELPEA